MSEKKIRVAIGELQERIDLYEKHYRGTAPEYYNALRTAVKALKRRLSVHPIKEKVSMAGREEYCKYVCPKCKKVLRPSVRGDYCPHCGQRIDWEEEPCGK